MQEDALFAYEWAPVGIVATRYRKIDHCNPAFARIFGYAPEDLWGQSLVMLYPSIREFADVGNFGLQAMTSNGRYNDERIMQRADGSQFWCQVHGASATPDDPYAHCVWSFIDISKNRPLVNLTRREREIAMFVVQGNSNKQIAQSLGISHRTVEAHRSRIAKKLGAETTAELVARLGGLH